MKKYAVDETFEVIYKGMKVKIECTSHEPGLAMVYKALIPGVEELFLSKGSDAGGNPEWNSIPKGRNDLARQIGDLIETNGM